MQNASAYSATKSAVKSIARVAANELADRKIRVNIISPGPTDTPNYSKLGFPEEAISQFKDHYASSTAVKRMGSADEIAKAVLFLASDDASFITGNELIADGGFINYALK
jgi:NAD(P)-dependent dehydrogenase (short-subunit alcohol dehydrogenase family)